MSEIDFIPKDKTNEFHKYDYASSLAIKQALHPLMVKHGVIFILRATEITHIGTITDIKFDYKFYDIESGEEIGGYFFGTGEDKLDKGTYKAITGAIKYILTSTFLIPTGEDPEKAVPEKVKPEYKGTQYENRPPAETRVNLEFDLVHDFLKTGISKKTNKPWYAIEKPDRTRNFINKFKYDELMALTGQDDIPLPDFQN